MRFFFPGAMTWLVTVAMACDLMLLERDPCDPKYDGNQICVTDVAPDILEDTYSPEAALLTISEAPVYDFGGVVVGNTVQKQFVVSYSGELPATSVGISEGALPFRMTDSNCHSTLTQSCIFSLRFEPDEKGGESLIFGLTYHNGIAYTQSTIELQGTGLSPAKLEFSAIPEAVFRQVPVGNRVDWIVQVSNAGEVPAEEVAGSGISDPFAFQGGDFPGISGNCGQAIDSVCDLALSFAPIKSGEVIDALVLFYFDGHQNQLTNLPLSGSGLYAWNGLGVGSTYTCGVDRLQNLFCWGENSYGYLGIGPTGYYFTSLQKVGALSEWRWIAGGSTHTCGIKQTGELFCWGQNLFGEVGYGGYGEAIYTPHLTDGAADWTRVAAGGRHSCGLKTNGSLWCWGSNENGQLGIGTSGGTYPTCQWVNGSQWEMVDTGYYFSCGISQPNGSLYCWGWNQHGELGTNSSPGSVLNSPTLIVNGTGWNYVSTGGYYTCGVNNGALFCWGINDSSQLGLGPEANGSQYLSPMQIPGASDWIRVAAGDNHTCGLKQNGALFCWGANDEGQLGIGSFGGVYSTPQAINGSLGWAEVKVGRFHTCGLKQTGEFYCWGRNQYGQLGIGNTDSQNSPVPILVPTY